MKTKNTHTNKRDKKMIDDCHKYNDMTKKQQHIEIISSYNIKY